ncbi:MAG: HRDC domain-containing protein [Chitinivibrionia bacterium]|nr:HRDC domain-containing protein [Chitinivibrionia bacterium]
MKYKTFVVSCRPSEGVQLDEMDKFVLSHNIVDIEKKFYQIDGGAAYWAFCVGYLDYGTTKLRQSENTFTGGEKPDYHKILDEKQYQKFEKYKEIRKELAKNAAVPPYTVFNDYELAEIAKLDLPDEKNIIEIKGISKNKAEKYGKVLLEKYADNVGAKHFLPLNNEINNVGAGSACPKTQTNDNLGGQTPPLQHAQQELF